MSFGGANIDATWLAGLGPTGSTTTSRIINVGGKIMVVGNTSGDFTIQGFQVRGSGDGGQFVICFNTSGVVQWVQSPVLGLPVPIPSVVAQDGRGVVNWTTPAASLVAGYTVDVSGVGTYSVSGSGTTSLDVSGLTNTVTYPVKVRSVNGANVSEYSATVGLKPMPVPPAPTGLSIAIGDKLMDISWTAPALTFVDGYTLDINGIQYDISKSAVTTRITGLLRGIAYVVKLRSYNNAYASTYTPSQVVIIPYVPVAPIGYRSIANGSNHTGVLLADGTMRTWGQGTNGQLGNGTTTASQTTAVTPTGISNCVAITCGGGHTAALLSDGTMRTWGRGDSGQLGNNTTTASQTTAVTPTGVSNIVAIACGDLHTAALLADGTMRTWGRGSNGQLGNGTTTACQLTAVTPTGVSNVIAIACGFYNTAALLADGTMRIWGIGNSGTLGNGTTTVTQSTAVTPIINGTVVAIACGEIHTAALLADGTMRTWGGAEFGQLGNGSLAYRTTGVTPCNISNVVAIACGPSNTAALLADGTMRTWGAGAQGRLGNGLTIDMSTAVTPCNISNAVAIAGGGSNISALLADGTMRIWGRNANGHLGIGNTIDMSTAVTPTGVSNISIVKSDLLRGSNTYIYPTSTQIAKIFCDTAYGYNAGTVPYLGVAVVGVTGSWEYMRDGSSALTTISGVSPSSALLLRGSDSIRGNVGSLTLKAWNGMGAAGEMSAVDTTVSGATLAGYSFGTSTMAISVAAQRPTIYKSIACGDLNGAALLADGTMRIWGYNFEGELGNNDTVDKTTPVTPCNISNCVAIDIGYRHTVALLLDGTMRSWGSGGSGVHGIGNSASRLMPVTPCNISNCVAMACGGAHTAALLVDGTMRIWGGGDSGQLGMRDFNERSTAVTPCNISNCVAIACGFRHTIALIADGTVRAWGQGTYGKLGNGSTADMSTAVIPTDISNCIAVACGDGHTAVLLADGTMRVWGRGDIRALGNGTTTVSQLTPVTPCNISNCVAIACGWYNTAALLADGTMRIWGNGVLGADTAISNSSVPVTPCNISNIVAIAGGSSTFSALLADGTMRIWGAGANGRLGNGTTASTAIPVTPCNISNMMILLPSFKSLTVPLYNNLPLSMALVDLSASYQPGTVTGRGIAIVGSVGSWEVSVNSGSSWSALGAVSASSAVTLRGDSSVRLRSSTPGTDTLTVKAWNGQQAVGAVMTTGVDTTVTGATTIAYAFSPGTITMTSTTQPVPPVPTLTGVAGGEARVNLSFSISSTTVIAGYTVDVGGTTYNVTGSPATVTGVAPGTVAVKVRTYNYDGVASAYSTSLNATVVPLSAPITYRSIALSSHTAVVLANGTMRTFGRGSEGQLGNNAITQQTTPVTVCNISSAVSVACGLNSHTAALLTDGTMRIWGTNRDGRLGNGIISISTTTTPITPCNISNIVAVACGYVHTAALLADGTMRTWGDGGFGMLGNNLTIDMSTAVTPCNISNCVAIACGEYYTAALIADGTVRTWGYGNNGRLGNGSTADQAMAVTPTGVSNAIEISCGTAHTAALIADGTVQLWGSGSSGQLGNNSNVAQLTAVTATGVSNVVAIACGGNHTAALLADGTMRTWGAGAFGQLGNGTATASQTTAVTPTGVSNVVAIAAGTDNTSALLADGTMRIWGAGGVGQLGNGLTTASQTTAVTPTGVSGVAIVKPSFKVALTTVVNRDLSSVYFLNITTGYQPGTLPYRGIAVTATTGTWQYSTNSGSSWTTINGVSAAAALALRLEPTVRIKCTAAGVLTVNAWSAQQATPATATSNVDTTVVTATIQGYSFGAATTTITAA